MILNIQIDKESELKLDNISKVLHQSQNDIIKSATDVYFKTVQENNKKNKILNAVKKCKNDDINIYNDFESSINDNL